METNEWSGIDPLSVLAVLTQLHKPSIAPQRNLDCAKPIKLKNQASKKVILDPIEELCKLAESKCCVFSQYQDIAKSMYEHAERSGRFCIGELVAALQSYIRGLMLNSDGGATLTSVDTEFCRYMATELKKLESKLRELDPSDLVTIVSSFDSLGYRDTKLLGGVGRAILQKKKMLGERDLSTIVRAFTRAGLPLKGDCVAGKRPSSIRDWERPPPPKKPKPISEC